MADGGSYSPNTSQSSTSSTAAGGATALTPDQIAQMNAQTKAYQDQVNALNAQVQAQQAAQAAGPTLQYNLLNEDGSLKSNYQLGSADSYLSALKQQEALNATNARDTAATQGQTATAQAEQNLAMRGGVGANNRALLETQGMKQSLANQQAASNQSAQNQAAIGVQGAGSQLQIDQANLQNQLNAGQNVNAFNLNKYNQNMAIDAANKQANATESAANSGKK